MKIAIIGSGISGLAAAWMLYTDHEITVYESASRTGGHANSFSLENGRSVDTGFIVYNTATYPNLIALFEHLRVGTCQTDMSFAVSMEGGRYEYSGDALFAQKRNLVRPAHYKMIADIIRFFKTATKVLEWDENPGLDEFLEKEKYSKSFRDNHIRPMAAAIWSGSTMDIADFPAKSFVRFFKNHGLLEFTNRPPWRTVKGGSQEYIKKLIAPFEDRIFHDLPVHKICRHEDYVEINDHDRYDHVVIATHTDQALSALSDPDDQETKILGSFPYGENTAYLHSDPSWMPRNRKAWASWNYLGDHSGRVCVTYWMNRLQPFLPEEPPLFVTLNPPGRPNHILYETSYAHPQYTSSATRAWENLYEIQQHRRTWYCGAWCGYGFHEDGLNAGLAVGEMISGKKRPWKVKDKSPAGNYIKGPVSRET